MTSLLITFTSVLQAEQRRDKRLHAVCPFCTVVPSKRKHFSFDAKRYTCMACHAQGTLATLAIYVDTTQNAPRRAEKPVARCEKQL